jgi:hypothetical protein
MLKWYFKWKYLRKGKRRFDYQINGERKIGHSFHHHLYAGAAKLLNVSKYNRIQIRRRKILYVVSPPFLVFLGWFSYQSYLGLQFY